MAAMRLAEACGEWDVDGMLSKMSHDQWHEWLAKDLIEPIGSGPVTDILAKIGQMIAAFMGSDLKESDLLPWKKRRQKEKKLHGRQAAAFIGAQLRLAAGNGGNRSTGH